jgi:hypothetical protein
MDVDGLAEDEKTVLVGLVRHLSLADGHVSDTELFDLIRLGVALGKPDFRRALEATEETHHDGEAMLELASAVTRPSARQLILGALEKVASGDGLHDSEASFIAALRARWAD